MIYDEQSTVTSRVKVAVLVAPVDPVAVTVIS